MQAAKRCVRCNTWNDSKKMYCVKCGKYLSGKAVSSLKAPTVWEQATKEGAGINLGLDTNSGKTQKYVVICPECNSKSEAVKGRLPLACEKCGYFFQVGLDQVVPESDAVPKTQPNTVIKKDSGDTDRNTSIPKKNPLARVSSDTSKMRLIPMGIAGARPESVSESGGIIGEDGTVLTQIRTTQQISIVHTPTGWYARTLKGQPLYNGVPQNIGVQIKLMDGDIIIIEKAKIRVEIV